MDARLRPDIPNMTGIEFEDNRGVIAAYGSAGPEILGEGRSLSELAVAAQARLGDQALATPAVFAVPAWLNDMHREGVIERAREAGFKQPRLINRPAAVALAHFASNPAECATFLVLELVGARLDVAVVQLSPERFEILATHGVREVEAGILTSPAKFFESMEKPIQRALDDARVLTEELDDILLAGDAAPLRNVRDRMATSFGREGSVLGRPEHTIALGAAVHAKLLKNVNLDAPSAKVPHESAGAGCGTALFAILAIVWSAI